MKHKQWTLLKLFTLTTLSIILLAACSNAGSDQNPEWEVSKQHPIFIDEENKIIKVFATVNGKYLVTPTRHGMNWIDGNYGNQAVLTTYGSPLEFYEALLKIGGNPAVEKGGDTSKEFTETADGKFIKGDEVAVTIYWENAEKEYDINEVMIDSTGKELNYHFGGNYDMQEETMTGCYMCFDSCPAGITSNANQPVGAFESGTAEFRGNPDILPPDGTPVVLTYSIVN